MATGKGKKLYDLRVDELKLELEKRDLPRTGNRADLRERLNEALKAKGIDPDKWFSDLLGTPKRVPTAATPGSAKKSPRLKDKGEKEEKVLEDKGNDPLGDSGTPERVPTPGSAKKSPSTFKEKAELAKMTLKGGIIMDVTTPDDAKIAEEAGAFAVVAIENVPEDTRREGRVARMIYLQKIKDIINTVKIPVIAKVRIGHFAEAQILQALGVGMIDESEVLTPADEENHINKHDFQVPFVCGARDLGEALCRISEGAAMIRTKGEAGIAEAVKIARKINKQIKKAKAMDSTEIYNYAKELRVPFDLLQKTADQGSLPVINFAAGGIATPADVSLMMQLGVDGVFVGSEIFNSSNPYKPALDMAEAVTLWKDPNALMEQCLAFST